MIYNTIQGLIRHGIRSRLITEEDELVVRNQLMDLLHLTDWEDCEGRSGSLDELLDEVVDYACANGIIEQTAVQRDLFDTRVMGVFTPMPHEVNLEFSRQYAQSPEAATNWYYAFCKNLNYVRAGQDCKGSEMDLCIRLRYTGYHHQPVKAGKGSPGHSRS